MENVNVKVAVGGHDISLYTGSVFDPAVRKYRGGNVIATLPYSGTMLSAVQTKPADAEPLAVGDIMIPTTQAPVFTGYDPVPDDGCFYVVSQLYLAAVRQFGGDTNRLLTLGPAVVDDSGRVIGTTGLVRN